MMNNSGTTSVVLAVWLKESVPGSSRKPSVTTKFRAIIPLSATWREFRIT